MLNTFLNKWVGDANTPLSTRLFHLFCLVIALGSLLIFIIDGIQLDTKNIRIPLLEALPFTICLILYCMSFYKKQFETARKIACIVSYGVLWCVWYYIGGTSNFFGTALTLFTCFFVFIVPAKYRIPLAVFNISLYFALMLIEVFYPNATYPALSGQERLISHGAASLIVMASYLAGLSIVADSFKHFKVQSEHDRNNLEALSAVQTQMISIISHDVRAPLGNIAILLGMIKNGSVAIAESPKVIEQVMKNVMSSREVLESMVGWTRAQIQQINDGDTEVTFTTPAVPAEIIENNIDDWREIAANKNVEIQYLIHCQATTRIAADNNLLRTVLRNLILNAVKYTNPKGMVQITVMKVNHFVVITIVDNGVGMSAERLAQLFKGKLNSKKGTDNEGGSGIGLFIVSDMLQRVGAKIEVKSEVGKGTVFTLTFEEFVL
jgi:two-component system, sensor histidine kinase and response regulator